MKTEIFEVKLFNRNLTNEQLFENMKNVWLSVGRQPVSRDFKKPISTISASTYFERFGTFRNSLQEFAKYTSSTTLPIKKQVEPIKHKTQRHPNNRIKVSVLMRDGNVCQECKRVLIPSEIRFDHIIPWSKGGETTLENLQILCNEHNVIKANKVRCAAEEKALTK